jgi:hypothetical protein
VSSNFSTSRVLQLLDQLKAALENFAGRAEKLSGELRTRVARERHSAEKALQEHDKAQAAAIADAESNFKKSAAEREQRYEKRKTWIGRAYQSSKEAGLEKIEHRIGAKKYELQKRMLQAERDREGGYAASATRLEELRTALSAEQARMEALEAEARRRLRGFGSLSRKLSKTEAPAPAQADRNEEALLADLRNALSKGEATAATARGPLVSLFRFLPLWFILALVPIGFAWAGKLPYGQAGAASAGVVVLAAIGRMLASKNLKPKAAALSDALAAARQGHEACSMHAEQSYTRDVESMRNAFILTSQQSDSELKAVLANSGQQRVSTRMRADERTVRASATNDRQHQARVASGEKIRQDALATIKEAGALRAAALRDASGKRLAEFQAGSDSQWRQLQEEWLRVVPPILDVLSASTEAAQRLFPPWDSVQMADWTPPRKFSNAVKYGVLRADLAQLCTALPEDRRLELPTPRKLELPLCLTYPSEGSILFETAGEGGQQAVGALNNIIFRLLANTPPGRVNFTIIDPVGLGQNFAGIMHMADYEEQIINSRIWTQSAQIEEKLAQLNEHMEKVIQMYLRNEYATIAEYNEQAGVIAEKYHFLVVADFPHGFTDTAARRLLSIAASGPRCGVYTLLHWDKRQPLPQDFPAADLRKASVALAWRGAEFGIVGRALEGVQIQLDPPPSPEKAIEFIHVVGKASRDSSRVEVPFDHVAPPEEQMWSVETSSELRVAIGRTGATKLQYLAIGKGTRQHGLIAGKTGSGKSTLFHVIITNLSMWCRPEEVEFYLVDFKKGVEFKCYASTRLPHAKVVAIESDREFGLSVLQRIDDELRRRGDLFRKLGVQDIPGYKRAGGTEPIPRCLLLIDEFQEFFVEDDKIAQTASMLLDRIVRQGRAFGIHVLLGSQTLGGAYTVARTTLGQMVIRIALQCNEADAYLIFEDDNPAPRLLSRPGEAIYNDAAGAVEGNSPFQVVWLPDHVRDTCLAKVRARAESEPKRYPGPIVFEGNAPSDALDNTELSELLNAPATTPVPIPRIWLGAPNSIKGPTEAVFKRQSGNNLLIVGQREEAILAMIALGATALSAQFPPGGAEIFVLDSSAPGTQERDYLEKLAAQGLRNVKLLRPGDAPAVLAALAERKNSLSASEAEVHPATFLLIHGLQRMPKLRFEDDFSFSSSDDDQAAPGKILNDLVADGARLGIHVIASCDSYNNVTRFFSRKAISEFEMRVVFQMSANDSASLIDSPRASNLGLHRALFFNAQEGYIETFRPYALPEIAWLKPGAPVS